MKPDLPKGSSEMVSKKKSIRFGCTGVKENPLPQEMQKVPLQGDYRGLWISTFERCNPLVVSIETIGFHFGGSKKENGLDTLNNVLHVQKKHVWG